MTKQPSSRPDWASVCPICNSKVIVSPIFCPWGKLLPYQCERITCSYITYYGGDQLTGRGSVGRAPALDAGSRRFESYRPDQK